MRDSLILVVEDNVDTREMYMMYLAHLGYRTISAADGLEALAVVAAQRPDLILLDVTMPRLDGWDTARRLKEDPTAKVIPLLILTAHAFREHRDRAQQLGADGFLAKPILLDDLAREIRRALRRAPQGS
jgi:two-component system cell cycle response regulator DivK